MPLDSRSLWSPDKVFTEREIVALLARDFEVKPLARSNENEPANYYLLNGHFRLGVISTISNPFCARCDRIRLTCGWKAVRLLVLARRRRSQERAAPRGQFRFA